MDPLEFLAQSNGCMISDLRYWEPGRCELSFLLEREAEDFSVSGWNALSQYMFPGAPVFQTQAQAWEYLKQKSDS